MTHAVFWILQDLLGVLTAGTLQVSEIFLLSLTYSLLTKDRDAAVGVIWSAFLGGLLWDLRWVGIPGFFTLGYVGVILVVIWVWNALPLSGRTSSVVFFLFWTTQLLPPILFLLILGRDLGGAGWTLFAARQMFAIPLSFLGVFFYERHRKNQNS
jgi:rod shape-determining protein MreD